jgi:ABC-type branched-subunit amino acid transport system substrate-binding protein
MKRWLSFSAIAVLCLSLVISVACGGGEEEEGVKEVKFGIGMPLSGLYGFVGIPALHAIELANEKIGEFTVAGETYCWKLITEDNMMTGAGGVASATKLIFEDGVKLMHQAGTDPSGASQTICEESGVLLDMGYAPRELMGPDKPRSTQINPIFLVDTPVLFQWVTTAYPEVKTLAIALSDNAFGHSIGEAAVDAAPYFGLEVVAVEWIPVGLTELYPLATKLADINPDLIICDVITLQPMREMGYEGRSAYTGWVEAFGEYIGYENYQGGMIYQANPYGADLPQEVRDLSVELEQRHGEDFSQFAYYLTTILFVMTEVLKKAGTVDDVDRILETIHTETFDTWIGPVHFAGEELIGINNIMLWPAAVHEIRGEEYTLVFEMSLDEAYALAVEVYKEFSE